MATFTLDELRADVEKRYERTVLKNGMDEFVLEHLLQLPRERRTRALELVSRVENDDVDLDTQLDVFRDVIRVIVKDDRGDELLGLLGGNSAMLMGLVEAWIGDGQLGEAGRS